MLKVDGELCWLMGEKNSESVEHHHKLKKIRMLSKINASLTESYKPRVFVFYFPFSLICCLNTKFTSTFLIASLLQVSCIHILARNKNLQLTTGTDLGKSTKG